MSGNFGFGPDFNPDDFNLDASQSAEFKELFAQLSNFGLNPANSLCCCK